MGAVGEMASVKWVLCACPRCHEGSCQPGGRSHSQLLSGHFPKETTQELIQQALTVPRGFYEKGATVALAQILEPLPSESTWSLGEAKVLPMKSWVGST